MMFSQKQFNELSNEIDRQGDVIRHQNRKLEQISVALTHLNISFDSFKQEATRSIQKSMDFDTVLTYIRLKKNLMKILQKDDKETDLAIYKLITPPPDMPLQPRLLALIPKGIRQTDFLKYYKDLEAQYYDLTV